MTLPLSTTTITVLRRAADDTRDPYEAAPAASAVAEGVRAVITAPSGVERVAGGSQEDVLFGLRCDPTDILATDQVKDETTLLTYEVVWAEPRAGLGLEHTTGALRRVVGVV